MMGELLFLNFMIGVSISNEVWVGSFVVFGEGKV
jgi:hypothetical protein